MKVVSRSVAHWATSFRNGVPKRFFFPHQSLAIVDTTVVTGRSGRSSVPIRRYPLGPPRESGRGAR